MFVSSMAVGALSRRDRERRNAADLPFRCWRGRTARNKHLSELRARALGEYIT